MAEIRGSRSAILQRTTILAGRQWFVLCYGVAVLTCCTSSAWAGKAATDAQEEFFEKKIRPVLVGRCYRCHSAEAEIVEAELLLDSPAVLQQHARPDR